MLKNSEKLKIDPDEKLLEELEESFEQLLDPNIEIFVSEDDLAQQIEEGRRLIEEESGITAKDVILISINGVDQFI